MSDNSQHHKIKVENVTFSSRGTKVFLDDFEVKGIHCLTFEHRAGSPPIITLELYPESVMIDGVADVKIDNALRGAYVSSANEIEIARMDSCHVAYAKVRDVNGSQ